MEPDDSAFIEVPISALAQWGYCPRRCALIHVEQTFDENVFTVRGRMMHNRADTAPGSSQRGVRVLRALPLISSRYGLTGRADAIEMHGATPVPIEYKLGRGRGREVELQLCAQALCLEEQFGVPVPAGAVYSYTTRRRRPVAFDGPLRSATLAAIEAVRAILRDQALPPPVDDARCPRCSLVNACLPKVVSARTRLRGHQGTLFRPLSASSEDEWDDV